MHPLDIATDGNCRISVNGDAVPVERVHAWLAESYWARGISLEMVRESVRHSFPFALYHGEELAGFARVISDWATFAYLADVFVDPSLRGRGLGRWLVGTVLSQPEFATVRGWLLKTRDAHGLYGRFGFAPLADPTAFMWRPRDRGHEHGG